MLTGKEQFWKAKTIDIVNEQFNQYEVRFEQILN
jgi:hypothetical protein